MGQYSSRQEVIATEMYDPRVQNWLCANIAMRETSQALAKKTHLIIARLHKDLLRYVGTDSICQLNCCRFDKPRCDVCKRWISCILGRAEQEYRSKINWSRFNSSQWPSNPYEVARVFMPRAHRLYYKSVEFHEDFRFSLSFLENCSDIPMPDDLCKRAWVFRSRLKRKHNLMRMGHSELEEGISLLKELASVLPDVSDNREVLGRLNDLTESELDDGPDGCNLM